MIKKLLLGLLLFATPVAAQTISPNFNGLAIVAPTAAIGGCTLGANAFCVTGSSQFTGVVAIAGDETLGSGNALYFSGRSQISSPNNGIIQFANNAGTAATQISVPVSATLQFGGTDNAAPGAQTLRAQSVVAGTAAANGANWTLIGSLPTGTGTSGDIIFKTGVKTGSGTTQGTATTALTIKGETQTVAVANNVTINGATLTGEALAATGSGKFSTTLAVGGCTLSGSTICSSGRIISVASAGALLLNITNGVDADFGITLSASGAGTKSVTIGSSVGVATTITTGVVSPAYTVSSGTQMIASTASFTNGAAAALGTLTNAPTAGNPTKWVPINDNGVTRYIPAW